jgi:hypothetical protein
MVTSAKGRCGITTAVPVLAKRIKLRISNLCVRTAAMLRIHKHRRLSRNHLLQNGGSYDHERDH